MAIRRGDQFLNRKIDGPCGLAFILSDNAVSSVRMARHESAREDLMQEATGLARRAEWQVPFFSEPVVAGFKKNGACSVYFGAEPVLQFDASGGLRRAFLEGFLFRTQGTTLARLRRNRTDTASELLRHDLDEGELATFRVQVCSWLHQLLQSIVQGEAVRLRQVPEQGDVVLDVCVLLRRVLSNGLPLAAAIPGKR
jgi:hypothetical protein